MPDTATVAGLHYVTDADLRIRRRRSGRGFRYLGLNGEPIRDDRVLAHIRSLAIPPAWKDVRICTRDDGHIQATGRDARGRKQYRYHARYRAHRDETKFDRIGDFSEVLPSIRVQVERDLSLTGLPRAKVLATVVRLLEKTLIRVGSDVYARENRSYGLTTLRRRHVEVSGSRLRFSFQGKSGVTHSVAITDRRIAAIVQHCQTLPGQELFQYLDDRGRRQRVDSGDINDYLREITRQEITGEEITAQEVTAKDFRTWAGTMAAAMALSAMGPAESERAVNANILRALDEVARRLGNTRAVCRHYYVHPRVIELYREGIVARIPAAPDNPRRAPRRHPVLRREEVAVLELLRLRPPRRTRKK